MCSFIAVCKMYNILPAKTIVKVVAMCIYALIHNFITWNVSIITALIEIVIENGYHDFTVLLYNWTKQFYYNALEMNNK